MLLKTTQEAKLQLAGLELAALSIHCAHHHGSKQHFPQVFPSETLCEIHVKLGISLSHLSYTMI